MDFFQKLIRIGTIALYLILFTILFVKPTIKKQRESGLSLSEWISKNLRIFSNRLIVITLTPFCIIGWVFIHFVVKNSPEAGVEWILPALLVPFIYIGFMAPTHMDPNMQYHESKDDFRGYWEKHKERDREYNFSRAVSRRNLAISQYENAKRDGNHGAMRNTAESIASAEADMLRYKK